MEANIEKYKPQVNMQVYVGIGTEAIQIRENIEKRAEPFGSVSRYVLAMIKKADPKVFKGVGDGKRA